MNKIILLMMRIISAVILGQSLWFKFTGAPEAVASFTLLGMEPVGRILIGIIELVVVIFLLIPPLVGVGALIGMGVMFGAVIAHLTRLGIVVQNDNGLLFGMAVAVLIMCGIILYYNRDKVPFIGKTF